MLQFGKKRKTVRTKSVNKVKSIPKYCIKKTKAGRRVVKVESKKKGRKMVIVYSSTGRPIGKTTKCYKTKAMATRAMKMETKKKTSKMGEVSFGAKRKTRKRTSVKKKLVRPYGFVACVDPNPPYNRNGYTPKTSYKVYKFFSVKWQGMTYNIVLDKSNYGQTEYFLIPDQLKKFKVTTSKGDATRRASEKKQKALAAYEARKYELLSYTPAESTLIKCREGDIQAIAQGASKVNDSFFKGLKKLKQLTTQEASNLYKRSSQINRASQNYNTSLYNLKNMRPIISGKDLNKYFLGDNLPGRGPRIITTGNNGEKQQFNPRTNSVRSFRGMTQLNSFGGRINYGFSKYF